MTTKNFRFKWRPIEGSMMKVHEELWCGKWIIGEVGLVATVTDRKDNYIAKSRLPGFMRMLGRYKTLEEAKSCTEKMSIKWFQACEYGEK